MSGVLLCSFCYCLYYVIGCNYFKVIDASFCIFLFGIVLCIVMLVDILLIDLLILMLLELLVFVTLFVYRTRLFFVLLVSTLICSVSFSFSFLVNVILEVELFDQFGFISFNNVILKHYLLDYFTFFPVLLK